MPMPGHSIHRALATSLDVVDGQRVLDLGCGTGGTLQAVAERAPGALLHGCDVDPEAVAAARTLLGGDAEVEVHDLNKPTRYPAGSMDAVVCHDVLEFLRDPAALIDEAARLLRPGGTAVISHTDYDALVIRAGDPELTRAVCHGWAEFPEEWMEFSDAWMGRKAAALVRKSLLCVEQVDTHVTVGTELTGFARHRVEQIAAALRERAVNGTGPLSVAEIDEWTASVERAARDGEFFYAETAFLVRATAAYASVPA
ncbi:methyltransferase domain-containing protein [Streptomyces sp. DT2A-34]|uniref:methyltransferase domain-containing protein n=1 Tax=Streptomyces sp. DT2A-34 TaxID=3051182 RepID=UPI00265B7903|nr:methyltransferase domain-containing protein [Streptomyces sp. DT2A-34]MDO0912254.1 methyltransferase domain-containing protein [Streptomyces sp. DT2A-34]